MAKAKRDARGRWVKADAQPAASAGATDSQEAQTRTGQETHTDLRADDAPRQTRDYYEHMTQNGEPDHPSETVVAVLGCGLLMGGVALLCLIIYGLRALFEMIW